MLLIANLTRAWGVDGSLLYSRPFSTRLSLPNKPPPGKDAAMLRRMTFALTLLASAFASGCANGRFYNPFRTADRPEDVQAQRIRATVHDPYPDQDKGPEVDDARPRDYQQQTPEPVRNRFSADNPWGGGR